MSVTHPIAADDEYPAADRHPAGAGDQRPARGRESGASQPADAKGAAPILPERVIAAPRHLGLGTRAAFRAAASSLVERISTGTGRLVIDCANLESIDSAGLNTLILVQRHAAKRRICVALRQLNDDLVNLLMLTKLDDLFEFQDGQTR